MTLTLSEAIRLGAMLKPQGFGLTFGEATCALGAALEAVGATTQADWMPVYRLWPITSIRVLNPVCGREMLLGSTCWILNDKHKWTREAIADWVEQIERAQAPAVDAVDDREAVTGHGRN